jgi:SAM-dependent methyltransferase
MTTARTTCTACGKDGMSVFYEARQVPVHSVLLMPTRDEALRYPKGDIDLAFCPHCGFIGNIAFNPTVHEYSSRYEETQGFSDTFNAFHRGLALRLIEQFDLHGKTVIEIGCGKGEFLSMVCELGRNRGIGFDPAYVSERNTSEAKDRIRFVKDFYSEKYADTHGDFVCCKMTLEHIPSVAEFVGTVRRSIGDRRDTVVFFQIPEVRRILHERAFWDVYYEHCSYFSKGSLARLFRRCGFVVVSLGTEYDDQYLTIEARPGNGSLSRPLPEENDLDDVRREVDDFRRHVDDMLVTWTGRLADIRKRNRRAVIWGAGSKGVAFLTKLNIREEITYAVDINPYKRGTYMAGTGQEIVTPDFLVSYRPDIVIVMNPIYCDEIRRDLEKLGVSAEVVPIVDEEKHRG